MEEKKNPVSMAASGTGKRPWRRWDDVEERLLAAGVKTYGTKNWEKVQQHMGTDRTIKQLSDHWVDRQEQCKELLDKLGPAPRPNRPSVAAAYGDKAAGEAAAGKARGSGTLDKKLKGQAALLTRVPSLRYRFHPYQRDDRVRQAAEAADTDRVREALGRYLTHVQWLEEALVPARRGAGAAGGSGEGGGNSKGGLGGIQVKNVGADGKVLFYDESTLAAQEARVCAARACAVLCGGAGAHLLALSGPVFSTAHACVRMRTSAV